LADLAKVGEEGRNVGVLAKESIVSFESRERVRYYSICLLQEGVELLGGVVGCRDWVCGMRLNEDR
jgi:hypothetical protein